MDIMQSKIAFRNMIDNGKAFGCLVPGVRYPYVFWVVIVGEYNGFDIGEVCTVTGRFSSTLGHPSSILPTYRHAEMLKADFALRHPQVPYDIVSVESFYGDEQLFQVFENGVKIMERLAKKTPAKSSTKCIPLPL